MPDPVSQVSTMACPRCGYDQRGVMALWTEQCPLTGRCSECGLEFAWAEVLRPDLSGPRWCIEFSRGTWEFARSLLTTILRLLWPLGFWRGLQMHHAPRFGRLAALLMCLAVVPVFLVILMQAVATAVIWQALGLNVTQTIKLNVSPPPSGVTLSVTRTPSSTFLESIAVSSLLPLSEIAPGTITESTVFVNGPRAGTPLTMPVSELPNPQAILNNWLLGIRGLQGSIGFWQSDPAINNAWGWHSYSVISPTAGFSVPHAYIEFLAVILGLLIMVACSGIAFVALPQSRRQAKVRWSHVWRVCLYAMGCVLLVPTAVILLRAANYLTGSKVLSQTSMAHVVIATCIFLVFWWSAASSRYLKMRHGLGIGIAVVVLGNLLPLAAFALVSYVTRPWEFSF